MSTTETIESATQQTVNWKLARSLVEPLYRDQVLHSGEPRLDHADGMADIYNPTSKGAIVTFNIKGVFAQDAATFLNSRGIACRSGNHCAKILIDYLHVGATVRASFYLYNTKEDIDALVDAVRHGKEFLDAYF